MLFSRGDLLADLHGLVLGALFLLAYSGGLAGLIGLRTEWKTERGLRVQMRRLKIGTVAMAVIAWLTVLVGTYLVYPLYQAQYRPVLSETFWNTFAMAWKIHLGWIAPLLATAVAYVVNRYDAQLAREVRIRQALEVVFTAAFLAAAVTGLLGALTTKVLPVE